MVRTVKLYIYKDGIYHYCKQEMIKFNYIYVLKKDYFVCLDCDIKFPTFLALGFQIRKFNHCYGIGYFKDNKFLDSKKEIKSIEL